MNRINVHNLSTEDKELLNNTIIEYCDLSNYFDMFCFLDINRLSKKLHIYYDNYKLPPIAYVLRKYVAKLFYDIYYDVNINEGDIEFNKFIVDNDPYYLDDIVLHNVIDNMYHTCIIITRMDYTIENCTMEYYSSSNNNKNKIELYEGLVIILSKDVVYRFTPCNGRGKLNYIIVRLKSD
jgi:hypothetical protein